MQEHELLEKLEGLGLNQFGFIDKDKIQFSDEVRKMCEVNACGRYGSNWKCPPGVGSIQELKNYYLGFQKALFFNTVTAIEDSFDFEGMQEAGDRHREICYEIKERFAKSGVCNFVILGAGGCCICETCTYPSNKPCRYPEKAIASMEACGINVVELCASTGFQYINGPNTVSYFGLIYIN